MRVMTFNAGNGLAEPARLIELVRGSGADIVGLQEIDAVQGRALETALADRFPYRLVHGAGIPGKALLSRLPFAGGLVEFHPGRPDVVALIEHPDGPLRVIVAHPPPPRARYGLPVSEAGREQIRLLLREAVIGGPTLLLGDFNVSARQAVYREIAGSGLIDAFRTAGTGTGWTLPTRLARFAYRGQRAGNVRLPVLLRVDYVWHSPHLTATRAWVGSHAGSDHLPVLAELTLNDPPSPSTAPR